MNENELFNYLRENVIFDLEKSNDQYSKFDCVSHFYKCVFELKCRFFHYNDLMLEKSKYDALINENYRALYVNSTPKGIYFFDVKQLNPIWIVNKMPKETQFEEQHLMNKTYCLINIKESKKTISFEGQEV